MFLPVKAIISNVFVCKFTLQILLLFISALATVLHIVVTLYHCCLKVVCKLNADSIGHSVFSVSFLACVEVLASLVFCTPKWLGCRITSCCCCALMLWILRCRLLCCFIVCGLEYWFEKPVILVYKKQSIVFRLIYLRKESAEWRNKNENPRNSPWRARLLWDVEDLTLRRLSAHRRRSGCQAQAPAAPCPQTDILVGISLTGWVNLQGKITSVWIKQTEKNKKSPPE
jgi:hypothetical protein